MNENDISYQDSGVTSATDEVFDGNLPIEDAIERLRTRLLDLSSSNRLLKYRYPKGRCIQIVGIPNINQVFSQLIDGKLIRLLPVPDPAPDLFEGKERPDVRLHAERLGISVSPDFDPSPLGPHTGRRLSGLQVLQYPADIDRLARRLANEAKTAIDETGSNMLFAIFGFLEFYDTDNSERPFLAPILSVPVNMVKGAIDPATRIYQRFIQHSGEDLAENATLREKLKQFSLQLPELEEGEEPEALFQRIENAIRSKPRWKVKRRMTIGMLSFGKLAVWADLDPKKHTGLLAHPLIQIIFQGSESKGNTVFSAADYPIDDRPDADVSLVYDADSSQHSAIIDVKSGKNIVINGPPGTGKSQTITNIVAAALLDGKKVLFVSEKLAALEVVRDRLNKAHLGHFCLELHSHKTQKKKFLEDIDDRIQQAFQTPPQFRAKLDSLQRLKRQLANYAKLIGSKVGNSLDLTINEIFWSCEKRRSDLSNLASIAYNLDFPQASEWTLDHIRARRTQIQALADAWIEIDRAGHPHPWEGFEPKPFVPGDDNAAGKIVEEAVNHFGRLAYQAEGLAALLDRSEPFQISDILEAAHKLRAVPEPPEEFVPDLLLSFFDDRDPQGQYSRQAIDRLVTCLTKARELHNSAHLTLREEHGLSHETVADLQRRAKIDLLASVIELPVDELARLGDNLGNRLSEFRIAAAAVSPHWVEITEAGAARLAQKMADAAMLDFGQMTISAVETGISAVTDISARMRSSLDTVAGIIKRWGLPFDDRPSAIARLLDVDALDGLRGGDLIDQEELRAARELAPSPLIPGSIPLDAIANMRKRVISLRESVSEAFHRCREITKKFGLSCNGFTSPEEELVIIMEIAEKAPLDLLCYRRPSLANRSAADAIARMKAAIEREAVLHAEFETVFHLDAIPPLPDLKKALSSFRHGDRYFNFLNSEWRRAVKLYNGIAKEHRKQRAGDMADSLYRLLVWINYCEGFKGDQTLNHVFGNLFQGFATEVEKAEKLHAWHMESQLLLIRSTNLYEQIDLATIDATHLEALATSPQQVKNDLTLLKNCEGTFQEIVGIDLGGFRNARRIGWPETIAYLDKIGDILNFTVNLFARYGNRDLPPVRILQLMEARNELEAARADILALANGRDELYSTGDGLFQRLLSGSNVGWRQTISAVNEASAKAASLLEFLKTHVAPTSIVARSANFIASKINLDRAVAAVASQGEYSSWADYTADADRVTAVIRDVVGALQPAMLPGKSTADGFEAMATLAQAEEIMATIKADRNIERLFGATLKGLATDDHAIAQTHSWGMAMLRAELPPDLRRPLLSVEAKQVLFKARELLNGMETAYSSGLSALSNLARLGTLDLVVWNRDAVTPQVLLDKVESAFLAADTLMPLTRWVAAEAECKRHGLGELVGILRQGAAPPEALGELFEFAAYLSISKHICRECHDLSTFDGRAHTRIREDFKALDRQITDLTGQDCAWRIDSRKSVPDGIGGTLASHLTEMHLLWHEIAKQKRHIPIRQLIRRAGRALQELKPCFMMGPSSVAQYLDPGALKFDLVVMDEASQLRPEDAIGAIARGSQLVVVGDPKQLPPTNFFDSLGGDVDDDDEAVAAVQGMESILDIAQQIFTPIRSLRWHYRSQHESLIAFSNHYFYHNLVVFPSPQRHRSRLGVKWRYVRDGIYEDRRNFPEAKHVVDAVVWHMKTCPDECLGVVTLNTTQRDLLEELLDRCFREIDECRAFIDRWEKEGWPFFVKNLENVQGDERDCIMISTTFGKPRGAMRVRQNFGPISRSGGWRRLNVLFTRARRRIDLFTSMQPEDILVDEKTPEGTRVFRNYLDYAKRGILTAEEETAREPDSDFEVAVARVLRSKGYEVRPQLGVAGYFIDLAVRNPDRPGEWLAAIECDGATYHSGLSVRDRDRIRQEILESLGWRGRIYRIWSTDWFYNPLAEAGKLLGFLEQRRTESTREQDAEPIPFPWKEDEQGAIVPDIEDDAKIVEFLQQDEIEVVSDDLFVEVGDCVTYCFVDNPSIKFSKTVIDNENNSIHNAIYEQTPIAQALLGLIQGEDGTLNVPGRRPRSFRVLKIERQISVPN